MKRGSKNIHISAENLQSAAVAKNGALFQKPAGTLGYHGKATISGNGIMKLRLKRRHLTISFALRIKRSGLPPKLTKRSSI
jgi:hypothetical protein